MGFVFILLHYGYVGKWAAAANDCGTLAQKICGLSGTPAPADRFCQSQQTGRLFADTQNGRTLQPTVTLNVCEGSLGFIRLAGAEESLRQLRLTPPFRQGRLVLSVHFAVKVTFVVLYAGIGVYLFHIHIVVCTANSTNQGNALQKLHVQKFL